MERLSCEEVHCFYSSVCPKSCIQYTALQQIGPEIAANLTLQEIRTRRVPRQFVNNQCMLYATYSWQAGPRNGCCCCVETFFVFVVCLGLRIIRTINVESHIINKLLLQFLKMAESKSDVVCQYTKLLRLCKDQCRCKESLFSFTFWTETHLDYQCSRKQFQTIFVNAQSWQGWAKINNYARPLCNCLRLGRRIISTINFESNVSNN